jgi:hypothetical protein
MNHMMYARLMLLFVIYGWMTVRPVFSADEFSQNNPDIRKYEFARSYITALSYMKDINDRWDKNAPKKLFADQKDKMILATLNDLSLDSSDLRIIKNYMFKYLTSPNMLMRKVADTVVVAMSREITINDEEKTLWQKWYDLNTAGQATRSREIDFVNSQHSLELRRKEVDKNIIQASVLMTKVLISEKNKNGQGHLLAITAQQRQKLLEKLDSFGSNNLDWGLKSGQRTLEGSIAVIREILEDSIWICIDEK